MLKSILFLLAFIFSINTNAKYYVQKNLNDPEKLKIEFRTSPDKNTIAELDPSLKDKEIKLETIDDTIEQPKPVLDGNGDPRTEPVLDENGDPVMYQPRDMEGNPIGDPVPVTRPVFELDENGDPVMETVVIGQRTIAVLDAEAQAVKEAEKAAAEQAEIDRKAADDILKQALKDLKVKAKDKTLKDDEIAELLEGILTLLGL